MLVSVKISFHSEDTNNKQSDDESEADTEDAEGEGSNNSDPANSPNLDQTW